MNRLQILRNASQALKEAGIDDQQEAEYALSAFLECSLSDLYVHGNMEVCPEVQKKMEDMVLRREKHEPLAYIIGERYFMGLRFRVSPSVLIPRQDTELLAEKAIHIVKENGCRKALDLCTGSGCLAISIAKYTDARVTASDISGQALALAGRNAMDNDVYVSFVESNLFEEVDGIFDVIVCNPPYISEREYGVLMPEVRDFEPKLALLAEENGLAFYRKILGEAKKFLAENGVLLFEIGSEQGADVRSLFEKSGFIGMEILQDYCGLDRVVLGWYQKE